MRSWSPEKGGDAHKDTQAHCDPLSSVVFLLEGPFHSALIPHIQVNPAAIKAASPDLSPRELSPSGPDPETHVWTLQSLA